MAADLSQVRFQYVSGMQAVEKLLIQLNAAMTGLSALYNGAGLSGTFVDAELAGNTNTKHMVAADIGTFTANLNTVQAAMSTAIIQNAEKCVGLPT
jgi:hypothetical protein